MAEQLLPRGLRALAGDARTAGLTVTTRTFDGGSELTITGSDRSATCFWNTKIIGGPLGTTFSYGEGRAPNGSWVNLRSPAATRRLFGIRVR